MNQQNQNQNPTNLSEAEIQDLRVFQFMMDHVGVGIVSEAFKDGSKKPFSIDFYLDLSGEFHANKSGGFFYYVSVETWEQMKEIKAIFTEYGKMGLVARECIKQDIRVNDFDNWSKHKIEAVKGVIKDIIRKRMVSRIL